MSVMPRLWRKVPREIAVRSGSKLFFYISCADPIASVRQTIVRLGQFRECHTVRNYARHTEDVACHLVALVPGVWPRGCEASVWELRKQRPATRDRRRHKKCGRNAGAPVS